MNELIDNVINGIVDTVGTNNVYDIASHLGIHIFTVSYDNELLKGNQAFYNRIGTFECIYLSNEISNKEFIIAHELGHALLHTELKEMFFNSLYPKGRLEREANYFATKLLYSNIDIEDGIETTEQLANRLGINEDFIKFIIEK